MAKNRLSGGSGPWHGAGGRGHNADYLHDGVFFGGRGGSAAAEPGGAGSTNAGGGPGTPVLIEDQVAEIIDHELHAANDADLTAGLGWVLDGDPEFLKRIAAKIVETIRR